MRARARRLERLLFASPAEVQFIRIMGGKVFTCGCVKSTKTRFPLTLVLSMGPVLRAENVRREVRVGRYFLDFANEIRRAIEIDGAAYHTDILVEQQRDEYLGSYGWLVLHISAQHVFTNPIKVRRAAESWLINGTLPKVSKHKMYAFR